MNIRSPTENARTGSMQFSRNRSNKVFVHLHLHWDGAMSIAHLLASCGISSILLTSFLLGSSPAIAQSTSNIERSPEAITLMQRVLTASGGGASIEAIHDLVATGTASAPMNSEETAENAVTISLRGLDQLRVDSTQPTGVRSIFNNRGSLSSKEVNGTVLRLGSEDTVSTTSHFFPLEHLAAALRDSSYSVTVPESVSDEESGHNLYHFRLQRVTSEVVGSVHRMVSSVALDYYVDATTDCILRIQNLHSDRGRTPIDNGRGPYEIYRFSNYRLDDGILLPHKLSVSLGKQLISTIEIIEYKQNTGLAESDFAPAQKQ